MIIQDIELTHFGKFHHKKIRFSQGMNVVYGRNEAGKSTIHAFIHCMLLGMEDDAAGRPNRFYDRYFPWENRGGYEGKMRIQIQNHVYRIERSFLRANPKLTVYDETAGEELVPAQSRLTALLDGMNETNYVNTISIEQLKSAADDELVRELEQFIFNTGRSKSVSLDISQAQLRLEEKARQLKDQFIPEADEAYEESEKKVRLAEEEVDNLEKSQRQQVIEYETLQKNIEKKQHQGEEALMQYERERDLKRRQYEAARKNWDNAPDSDTEGPGIFPAFFFLLLGLLFAGGLYYMYAYIGFRDQQTVIAGAGFSAAAVFCAIALIVTSVRFGIGQKRIAEEEELRKRLKEQLDNSITEFDDWRKMRPEDPEDACREMREELKDRRRQLKQNRSMLEVKRKEREAASAEHKRIGLGLVENRSITQELQSVEIALATLQKVSGKLQGSFGTHLCKESSVILSGITKEKYTAIDIDTESEKILVGKDEKRIPLEAVSRGTVEQVYLAIRIAAANLLWQKASMPFIFDDVFVYYDDDRLNSAMELLKECGHQVIIFSCNTRENKILEEG